mmetsp:Transcript_32850/g.95013  ORF Transcript_32850/g.95013 Transcript_32850/m.95013 type:complete len:238 (-) Transcript_32850:780-1493(-)
MDQPYRMKSLKTVQQLTKVLENFGLRESSKAGLRPVLDPVKEFFGETGHDHVEKLVIFDALDHGKDTRWVSSNVSGDQALHPIRQILHGPNLFQWVLVHPPPLLHHVIYPLFLDALDRHPLFGHGKSSRRHQVLLRGIRKRFQHSGESHRSINTLLQLADEAVGPSCSRAVHGAKNGLAFRIRNDIAGDWVHHRGLEDLRGGRAETLEWVRARVHADPVKGRAHDSPRTRIHARLLQ